MKESVFQLLALMHFRAGCARNFSLSTYKHKDFLVIHVTTPLSAWKIQSISIQ